MIKILSLLKTFKKSFINYYSFEKYILSHIKTSKLDTTKKIKITQYFWDNFSIDYNNSSLEILSKLNSFIINFNKNYESQKEKIENLVKLYDCGFDNYLKYKKFLKILIKNNVHNPDYKIILDAHEFSLTNEVCFITTDAKFFKKIIKCDFLKINEFKLCN